MDLTIETYDGAERDAREGMAFQEIQAFSTTTFDLLGFPSRVAREAEVPRYMDWNGDAANMQYLEEGRFVHGPQSEMRFTADEKALIGRISDTVATMTEARYGRRMRPITGLLAQLGMFRVVMALSKIHGRRLTVFEVGPGTGYLGALLLGAGQGYAAVDNAQGFYLWQSRLLRAMAGDRFREWVVDGPPSDPDRFDAHHLPWWHYVKLRGDSPLRADVIVSNANLCEMNPDALAHTLVTARNLTRDSPVGMFLFTSYGDSRRNTPEGVRAAFTDAGMSSCFHRLFQGFSTNGRPPIPATAPLCRHIPLFGSDPTPISSSAREVLRLDLGEYPPDVDFAAHLGLFDPGKSLPNRPLRPEETTPAHLDAVLSRATSTLRASPIHYATPDLVARHIAAMAPSGELLVYPLGELTKAILPDLKALPGVTIKAIVDRAAAAIGSHEGIPVITPEEAVATRFDRILILSAGRECELFDTLTGLGIDADSILTVFEGPDIHIFRHSPGERARIMAAIPAGIDTVILRGLHLPIIDGETLASAFPPDRAMTVGYRVGEKDALMPPFRHVHCGNDIAKLEFILEHINPRVVYMQTHMTSAHATHLVRRILPDAKIIHEVWDWWATSNVHFRGNDFARIIGMPNSEVEMNRLGEWYSVLNSDVIVSKRGGDAWKPMLEAMKGEYQLYFPQLRQSVETTGTHEATRSGEGPVRIVYASSLLPATQMTRFSYLRETYDPFPLFERLTGAPGLEVEIFNGSHTDDPRLVPAFAEFVDRYRAPPLAYHPRIPHEALLKAFADFDYGWMYFISSEHIPELDVVVPTKASTYICAGLPLIVSANARFVSELVREFDAGIVIEDTDPEAIREAILGGDRLAHRRGALRLRRHMAAQNATVVERLRELRG